MRRPSAVLTDLLQNDKKRIPVERYLLFLLATVAIILALPPWYSQHLQMESKKVEEKGDLIESLHKAKQAVSVDPLSVEALIVLAGAQQRMGRETEARNSLTRATDLQPLNYATWENLAFFERDLWGQQELAQEHFKIALGLNPYDEQLNNEAGIEETDQP